MYETEFCIRKYENDGQRTGSNIFDEHKNKWSIICKVWTKKQEREHSKVSLGSDGSSDFIRWFMRDFAHSICTVFGVVFFHPFLFEMVGSWLPRPWKTSSILTWDLIKEMSDFLADVVMETALSHQQIIRVLVAQLFTWCSVTPGLGWSIKATNAMQNVTQSKTLRNRDQ